MSLVTVTDLTKHFADNTAVNNVSLSIDKGKCIALLGPNGAGKTTTIKMLAGLLKPTFGTIQFEGSEERDYRNLIGYLPQYPAFYRWMTGKEYLVYAAELSGLPDGEAKEKAEELLKMMGIEEAAKRRISTYSGGMKQRLGLAQAMIHDPKLLILDEPVSALDPVGRYEVLEMIRKLKEKTTILFSTHILHDAEEVSDDIYIIRNGEIVLSGTLQELQEEHQQPVIVIETAEKNEEWLGQLETYAFVANVASTRAEIRIEVNDVDEARNQILKDILSFNIKVKTFKVGYTSLEDLFIKKVTE
ncbi:ABC transporter ATP-binding protein [Pseudalkalibacillus caeni]|uniref:ABC transporter ATP-binding protein n=1 Tax=Exobacillus caeni TaxID=2574798 RepID=A0A5R9FAH0_9BACL|nr:ABC transporter ATP-binding protein [Pseudalkalibacillus caeni]TLS37554.1 ABC transporter ATP-binding protein [Pseudalkalibacillus caeni]